MHMHMHMHMHTHMRLVELGALRGRMWPRAAEAPMLALGLRLSQDQAQGTEHKPQEQTRGQGQGRQGLDQGRGPMPGLNCGQIEGWRVRQEPKYTKDWHRVLKWGWSQQL